MNDEEQIEQIQEALGSLDAAGTATRLQWQDVPLRSSGSVTHGVLKDCTVESFNGKVRRVMNDVWRVARRSGGARVTVRETETHWVFTISDDPE